MSQPSPEKIDPPEPLSNVGKKRRGSFWWLVKWGSVVAVLFLLLLILGGWLAYVKRTSILNAIFEDAAAPYRIAAGRFDLDTKGNLDLYDVRLEEGRPDGGAGAVIEIPHASGVIDFRDALGGKFVSIAIDRPVIHVPLRTVMISEAPAGLEAIEEEVSKIAPAIASPRFALENLVINDAAITIGDTTGDAISARFDYDADALALYSDGSIETRRHRLSLRDVGFGKWVTIPTAEAEFSIHRKGGLVRLHSLTVPTAKIIGDEEMLQWLVDAGFGPLYALSEEASVGSTSTSNGEADVVSNAAVDGPFSRLEVEKLAIGELEYSVENFPRLPDFEGNVTLDCEGLRMPFVSESIADGLRLESLRLQLKDARFRLQEQSEFALLPATTLSMRRGDDHVYEISEIVANDMDISLTPGVVDFLVPTTPASSAVLEDGQVQGTSASEVTQSKGVEVRIVSGAVNGASLALSGFDRVADGREFFVPDIDAVIDGDFRDISLSNIGLQSEEVQNLSVSDARVTFPDASVLAEICGIQISLVPDDFLKNGRLVKCLIDSPDIRLNEPFWERLAEMDAVGTASTDTASESAGGNAPAGIVDGDNLAAWQRVTADVLDVHDGYFEFVQTDTAIPNFSARVEIETRPPDAENGQAYVVDASDLKFYAPADPSVPFARASSLEIIADSATLWSEKQVTSATLKDAELLAGKRFDTLLADSNDGGEATEAESLAPPEKVGDDTVSETPTAAIGPRPRWHVGEFHVESSVVVVEDLAPLIPDISLPVKATFSDFPLTKEGFFSHEEPLKVEVAQIRIPSPYGQARTPVAEFDSVFIHFSLAGLMRNELTKVELLHPTIYVGENLFWYVEFFRKAEAEDVEAPAPDRTAELTTPALAAATENDEWSIEQIDAFYGQLIIALNGNINPDLPAFPFNCSTALNDGTLSATLDIPGGDYRPLEGVDLMVKVTGGHADFNLPLGQASNNLVEVFEAEELRYKQFLTTEVHLSVTYDQYGIYAQFGGETYGGYTNGAVNLYINDDFTWDAWVTGSEVSATEMTRVLTPEYYLMSGAADFKVIAQGDLGSLYQAYGDFKMHEPGIISIPALDELKGKFPDDWTVLETSFSEVGIGALRDLPFETCTADFKIFEREGTLKLTAAGPSGSRDFEVAVHDYRLPAPVKILELAYTNDDVEIEPSVR